jgi:23S rRNA (adenine2503-C2)-methyltransferase
MTGEPGQTQKALFRLADGETIESVIMRDEDDPANPSFCISSQVGCALGCTFCMTGYGGFRRNLAVDEILGQAIALRRHAIGPDNIIHHLVFMGMGEPMHNLGAVIPAIQLLIDPDGFGLSRRRVTVSTAGMVNGIERFGEAGLGVGLAVSLNATTDAVRDAIMPVNRRWPIRDLLDALVRYPLEQRRRITIEYVLMRDVNDTPEDARRLVGWWGACAAK